MPLPTLASLRKKSQRKTMAIPNKGFIAKLKDWFS